MSKIDELIQQLCPSGVEFKHIWEVTAWDKRFNAVDNHKQAKTYKYNYLLASALRKLAVENGDVKLLSTGGEAYGWTTVELSGKNISEGEIISIPWGGRATVQYYNGKFVTADNRIATSLDRDYLDNKYLYYFMLSNLRTIQSFYRGSGIQHPSMAEVLDMKLPIPPIEVQNEIVNILDKFTQLEAELSAELSARRKQYEYYRDQLLTLDDTGVRWTTMSKICKKIISGGTPSTSRSDYYGGDIPWLRTQEVDWVDIYDTGIKITEKGLANSSAKMIPANCVIVAMYGATAAKVGINKIPLSTNQACCNLDIDEDKANYRYVFHWLSKEYVKLRSLGQGTQSNINGQTVKDYKIPLPPLSEQNRIVSILDKFDALVNSISEGLPAELSARRKQYEYYRTKLLTFQELIT